MLIKSEFKVDLFQMKHTKEPDLLLAAIVDANAAKLGRFLVEKLPYVKNLEKSYDSELPEMSLNKEHHYNDHYELELFVLTREQVNQIRDILSQHRTALDVREDIKQIIFSP